MNNSIKKGVVVAVILLFVSVSVIPSTGNNIVEKLSTASYDGDTLYVGGSGPSNYSKIQDAIDNASNGDTVFVYDDSSPYYENVVINISINLIGEDKNNTVIDGNESGYVVKINADWVNISGFTIQNCGELFSDMSGLIIHSSFCTISNNNIMNNQIGIAIMPWISDVIFNNTIFNNILSSNDKDGMVVFRADNNTISKNIVSNNKGNGIVLGGSNNNYIQHNIINLNNWYGLQMGSCRYNTVTGNIIKSSRLFGILLYSSWPSVNPGSCNNLIFWNTITNNSGGIELKDSSINNIIEKNNFIGNKRQASLSYSWRNSWNANYWDNWIGLKIKLPIFQKFPKVIVSIFPPWINFDWHPAQEPYDIGV